MRSLNPRPPPWSRPVSSDPPPSLTFGALSGQGAPTSVSSGNTTSSSLLPLQPMSCAEHSMPNESTPFRLRFSILSPLPGVVIPTGCMEARGGAKGD